jgi:hypothetical protein
MFAFLHPNDSDMYMGLLSLNVLDLLLKSN